MRVQSKETRQILFQGKFIRFLKEGVWEFVERINCRGVVIMAGMTDDQKVVFVEQYRTATKSHMIEFPAGLVGDLAHQRMESPATAAKREFEEETGYRPKKMILKSEGYANPGLSSDWVWVYKAEGLKKVSPGGGDPHEKIKVHEVPLKGVDPWFRKMKKKGFVIDPKVYLCLYFLKQP